MSQEKWDEECRQCGADFEPHEDDLDENEMAELARIEGGAEGGGSSPGAR